MSAPKIVTLQPNPLVGNEKVPRLSNPIPYPEFFNNLTAPNEKFSETG